MELDTLQALYVDELKDLYSAENQILKALPKMIKAAHHADLKRAFSDHLRQTEQQVRRLERIFDGLDESPKGKKCHGMQGVIEEGAELMKEKPDPDVLDAGLISAAQHVEHYEMAGYGTVRTWATKLGRAADAALLEQTLGEEKSADQLLTDLAEKSINLEAVKGFGDREVALTATKGSLDARTERAVPRRSGRKPATPGSTITR